MKKHRKQKKRRLKTTPLRHSSGPRRRALEPEDLVVHIRRAEQEVLPMIGKLELGPSAALFLLAQYTHVFATGSNTLSTEGSIRIADTVLSIWQDGLYVPSSQYPFTLEETLQEIQEGSKAKRDYADSFQAFTPLETDQPRGIGQVSGGIVRHPETSLWQIWLLIQGVCLYFGAYGEPTEAQRHLEEIIHAARRGGTETDLRAFYQKLQSQGDGSAQELSFDMMLYLIEHLDLYTIRL